MSDPADLELERRLRSRPLAPPSADLAARIAHAARAVPQAHSLSLAESLAQLFAEFRLPQPAIALTATLLLGVIAGWAAELRLAAPDDDADTAQVQSFLYPDDLDDEDAS
jgi:hypothetical protein